MSNLPRTPEAHLAWWEANTEVSYGFCWCGCGSETNRAKKTMTSRRTVAGCPQKYILGHVGIRRSGLFGDVASYRKMWKRERPGIPYGECWCGCGEETPIVNQSRHAIGHLAGEPLRYIRGHRIPKPTYEVVDMGYGTPCWRWGGNIGSTGYGWKWLGRKKQVLAHRYMYEQEHGPIPDGLHLDHLCRNPPCVNPAHLEPVTVGENIRRGKRTKLDWAKVREIRGRHKGGATNVELAIEFGVSQSNISVIVCNKAWKEGA